MKGVGVTRAMEIGAYSVRLHLLGVKHTCEARHDIQRTKYFLQRVYPFFR